MRYISGWVESLPLTRRRYINGGQHPFLIGLGAFCLKKSNATLLFAQNRIIYIQRQKVAVPVKLSAELVSGNRGWGGFALILFQAMPLRQKSAFGFNLLKFLKNMLTLAA